MTITVYSRPQCAQCTATTPALASPGLDYEVIDLTGDEATMSTLCFENLQVNEARMFNDDLGTDISCNLGSPNIA